jgi:hypothetical protein
MSSVFRVVALIALIAARAAPALCQLPETAQGEGFASVVAQLVRDSTTSVGIGGETIVTPADSITARLMREAGRPLDARPDSRLLCPGSTLASGETPPAPRGYFAKVEVRPSTDAADLASRTVIVTHSCGFMYRGKLGRGGAYALTEYWEVRLLDGRWRIARRTGVSVT